MTKKLQGGKHCFPWAVHVIILKVKLPAGAHTDNKLTCPQPHAESYTSPAGH